MALTQQDKELLKQEWLRCYSDEVYFLQKYAKIQHPLTGQKIPFELYDFQIDALNAFNTHQNNIILKSRQLGISTIIAGHIFHLMFFRNDANILVIAKDQDASKNLVNKIKVMYKNLPPWLRHGVNVIEDNTYSFKFSNDSIVKASAATANAGRSEALTLFVFDEAAFPDRASEIWTAASPALSRGGKAIIASTPFGIGNLFHQMWVAAEEGVNGFNTIRLPWTVHPENGQEWYEEQCKLLNHDKRKIAQELECNFNASGDTVFQSEDMLWYQENKKDPIHKRIAEKLWVWQEPKQDATYMVVADTARGDGTDYSVAEVYDIDTLEHVAEYRDKVDPKTFGGILYSLSTEYNDALLVIENANVGYATIQEVIDKEYKNLYYTFKQEAYVDESVHLRKRYDIQDKAKMTPGFTTSSKTRPLIIDKLCEYVRERGIQILSQRAIAEMQTFIWMNNKPQAMSGYNDDCIMALAIMCWVRDTAIRMRENGLLLTRASLNAIQSTKGVYKPHDTKFTNDYGWSMNVGRQGTSENLDWLLDDKQNRE